MSPRTSSSASTAAWDRSRRAGAARSGSASRRKARERGARRFRSQATTRAARRACRCRAPAARCRRVPPATGTTGKNGKTGQIELVVCNKVTKTTTVNGHKVKKTVQKCTTRLVSGRVKFTIDGDDLGASVSRASVRVRPRETPYEGTRALPARPAPTPADPARALHADPPPTRRQAPNRAPDTDHTPLTATRGWPTHHASATDGPSNALLERATSDSASRLAVIVLKTVAIETAPCRSTHQPARHCRARWFPI